MTGDSKPMRPGMRPLDFVFLLRPPSLLPLWIFQLAAARSAAAFFGKRFPAFLVPSAVMRGLLAMTLVLAGGFILNQIVDRESDRANRKLFFLADGIISLRAAWVELWLLWVAGALVSLTLPAAFRLVLLVSLALNATYSAPPLRAKARAPLDLVWNGLGFGFAACAAGWTSVGPLRGPWAGPALAYALAVAGVIASTTIPDIEGDLRAGLRTTGVALGARRTSLLALALLVAGAAVGWASNDLLGFYGPLLSLPLLLRAHATQSRPHRVMANQVAVGLFALVAGVRAPLLLALLAIVYFGTRAYYRARFGMSFPGRGTP
ncbi:MAG: hypothetical protein GF400_11305 [Candidatus Eisenbacteria bacterium]|nr:hypothetical protein [Candidatus Eisenbacteria bacterium]